MRHILLCCAAGMSTSLVVEKMKKTAAEQGYECEIHAQPFRIGLPDIDEADVVLLGPQVRFNLKPLQEKYPDKPSAPIDMMAYGMCDGAKILEQAQKLLGDK